MSVFNYPKSHTPFENFQFAFEQNVWMERRLGVRDAQGYTPF